MIYATGTPGDAALGWAVINNQSPEPVDRQRLALAAASPKRANPGRVIVPQADAGHLPLFIAANEPTLF
ncbi:MAG: hypothetical protein ACKVOB_11670 [Sphingomonas sp.]